MASAHLICWCWERFSSFKLIRALIRLQRKLKTGIKNYGVSVREKGFPGSPHTVLGELYRYSFHSSSYMFWSVLQPERCVGASMDGAALCTPSEGQRCPRRTAIPWHRCPSAHHGSSISPWAASAPNKSDVPYWHFQLLNSGVCSGPNGPEGSF